MKLNFCEYNLVIIENIFELILIEIISKVFWLFVSQSCSDSKCYTIGQGWYLVSWTYEFYLLKLVM